MKKTIPLALLLLLTACAGDDAVATKPSTNNYTIDVVRQPDGSLKAMAPKCKPWSEDTLNRLENDPLPQLGCATQGNLAKQIVDPADLVRDQLPAPAANVKADGDTLATGVRRYHEGQVYAPNTAGTTSSGGQ